MMLQNENIKGKKIWSFHFLIDLNTLSAFISEKNHFVFQQNISRSIKLRDNSILLLHFIWFDYMRVSIVDK